MNTDIPWVNASLWLGEALKLVILALAVLLAGLLVRDRHVRVNYTRKANFFALVLVPRAVDWLVPCPSPGAVGIVRGIGFVLLLAIFLKPVRNRVPLAATMFLSFDRPEDRPHTLFWLTTQLVAGYLVLLPITAGLAAAGWAKLVFIPILVHGIGDGLAEPVGVRFGRHRYETRGFLCDRRYTRSLEGSACVLAAGVLAVATFHGCFSPTQFRAALVAVPILMTLAEAWSPHTWDTPLMYLAGGASLLAIKLWL
jgi:phytol kinase